MAPKRHSLRRPCENRCEDALPRLSVPPTRFGPSRPLGSSRRAGGYSPVFRLGSLTRLPERAMSQKANSFGHGNEQACAGYLKENTRRNSSCSPAARRRFHARSVSRYVVQEGEVILGDRAYGTARGLHAVSQQGAKVVVRFNPASLRTCDLKRRRIHLEEREEKVPSVGAVEFPILIPIPPPPTKSHKTWTRPKRLLGSPLVRSPPALVPAR